MKLFSSICKIFFKQKKGYNMAGYDSAGSDKTINSDTKISDTENTKKDRSHFFNENRKSIAILIDCWDPSLKSAEFSIDEKNTRLKAFYNILQTVPEIPNLSAVILSTYDSNELITDTPFFKNTEHLFLSQGVDYIRENYTRSVLNYKFNGTDTQTYPNILNSAWPCMTFSMHEAWQVEYLINRKMQNIKNIFFLGMHLNLCVSGRPIGYDAINNLIKHGHLSSDVNLFTIKNCVLEWDHDHRKSRFPTLANENKFTSIDNFYYQIKGK